MKADTGYGIYVIASACAGDRFHYHVNPISLIRSP
jgi:hypothetical protein